MSAEVEYAVWVLDSAPGAGLSVTPVGSRNQAILRVRHYQAVNLTRSTYGISAKVVRKYRFMPEMDWEEVP